MATNLWPNADLESDADDWNSLNGGTPSHSTTQSNNAVDGGSNSVKCVVSAHAYSGIESDIKSIVSAETQYTFSVYVYNTGTHQIRLEIRDQDSNSLGAQSFTVTQNTWTRISRTFTTGAGDTGIVLRIFKGNDVAEADFYADTLMVETGASASAWVNYSSGTAIAVGNVGNSSIAAVTPVTIAANTTFTVGNVGNSSIAGYNPNTTIGTGLWEVGAYIYDVIGEIHVNVGNVGAVGVDGFNPATLSADTTFTVGNVGGVSIASPDPTVTFTQDTIMGNVGAVVIAGFAAVVTGIAAAVGGGITRIAMKMATILRR